VDSHRFRARPRAIGRGAGGTDLKSAAIDLSGTPGTGVCDGAADTVVENGTDGADHVKVVRSGPQVQTSGLQPRLAVSGSDPGVDTLDVYTLGGEDTVNVGSDVSTLIIRSSTRAPTSRSRGGATGWGGARSPATRPRRK
jgi:hypothetical protein